MKGYVLINKIARECNVDTTKVNYLIQKMLLDRVITEEDVIKLSKNKRETYEKENGVNIGRGINHKVCSPKAYKFIVSILSSKKEKDSLYDVIVNNDEKIKEIKKSLEKLNEYIKVYETLGFGKLVACENALNALNGDFSIFAHAEKTISELREERYKNKKAMLVSGLLKATTGDNPEDYRNTYKKFEELFHKRTGIYISMLSKIKDDNRYAYFIEKFNKWDVAFKIVNEMIESKKGDKKSCC